MRTRLTLGCLSAALLAGLALPQRPPSWVAQPAPGVQSAQVDHRGKLLWFVHQNQIHVFSAATRRWHSRPVSGSAVVTFMNDWLVVQEGRTFTALSSMTGSFEVLTTTNGQLLNPSGNSNDGIALVRDGTTLHAFAGLVGGWVARTVSPNAQIVVRREVAIVAEPNGQLAAMSGLFGRWRTTQAAGAAQALNCDGTAGFVDDGQTLFGFSAIRDTWASTPALGPGATLTEDLDVIVWADANEIVGFSGVRGTFGRFRTLMPVQVTTSDHLAIADSSAGVLWGFSAATAQWTLFNPRPGAQALFGEGVALWTSFQAGEVAAYSTLRGTFTTLPLPNPNPLVNATVAAAMDTQSKALWLYSAYTGQWYRAPQGAAATLPNLARNAAFVYGSGNRNWAFSARSGRFVPIDLTGATVFVDASSSLVAATTGTTLHVFEPRREVWLSTTLAGNPPVDVRIWRTCLVAFSDQEAAGFGVEHGSLEKLPLTPNLTDKRASSEVGAAIFSDRVVGYSAVSDLTTVGQFPEFRRMMTPGTTVDLHLHGPATSPVGAVAGFVAAVPMPTPFGDFLLDTAVTVALTPLTVLPGGGHAVLPIPVANQAGLRGLELGFQAIVLPAAPRQPYLTRLGAVRLH